jgi:dinuclear metal center YbgI/SA1388 family protein
MIKTKSLLVKLSKRFPKHIAKKYNDYVGLMCGKLPKQINSVYLALDMEETLLADVKKYKPDIIITHHPLVYGPRNKILKSNPLRAKLLADIEKLSIPVYSFHTNFDEGKGGMNDALAEKLELLDYAPLLTMPMARGGKLPKSMDVNEFALYAKKKLNADYAFLLNEGVSQISKVALIGGGGAKYFQEALNEGYDIFISGDIAHHIRRAIIASKFNYLDLPHEIESIFIPQMRKILLEIDPTLTIYQSELQKQMQPI